MPRRAALTAADARRSLIEQAQRPKQILVTCRVLVHDRRPDDAEGEPCPCCRSTRATIVREYEIDRLLIDTETKKRALRSRNDAATFDRLCAGVLTVDMPLRIYDHVDEDGQSLEAMLHDTQTKTVIVAGGNRSGKSTFLTDAWLPLRWLRRGGPTRKFRVMGPDLRRCHIMKKKMVVGEGDKPPAFPPELVVSYPQHERSADQRIVLVDGSVIELIHAQDGGTLKGEDITDQIWTEVAECKDPTTYTVASARTTQSDGQTALDSTPVRGHWLEPLATTEAKRQRILCAREPGKRAIIKSIRLPMLANPWLRRQDVLDARAAAEASDPIWARREFDAEWVGEMPLLFGDVWDPGVHVASFDSLKDLELEDVTPQVARRHFRGKDLEWIAGVDVNLKPHTAVVLKIAAPKGKATDPSEWRVVVHREIRTEGDAYDAALALGKAVPVSKCGVIPDATSANKNAPTGHHTKEAQTPAQDYQRAGFEVRPNLHPRTRNPSNPPRRDAVALLRHVLRQRPSMLIIHSSCKGLIRAIEMAEDANGVPHKVPGGTTDRDIAAFLESLWYPLWPFFRDRYYTTKKLSFL